MTTPENQDELSASQHPDNTPNPEPKPGTPGEIPTSQIPGKALTPQTPGEGLTPRIPGKAPTPQTPGEGLTPQTPDEALTPDYWNNRYLRDDAGWDMRQVSPPLKNYFSQLQDKSISILIPGCGNAYEAGCLLDLGFSDITLVDISAVLIQRLRTQYQTPALKLIEADFFELEGEYDLIVEQTFFCALSPSLRKPYAEKMYQLLKRNGKLAGLLFDRDFPGGPPFGGHRAAYETLLGEKLHIKTMEPCYNSIRPRAGTELFFIAEKKS